MIKIIIYKEWEDEEEEGEMACLFSSSIDCDFIVISSVRIYKLGRAYYSSIFKLLFPSLKFVQCNSRYCVIAAFISLRKNGVKCFFVFLFFSNVV